MQHTFLGVSQVASVGLVSKDLMARFCCYIWQHCHQGGLTSFAFMLSFGGALVLHTN